MKKKAILLWGTAIAVTILLITILEVNKPYQYRGALIDPPLPAPPITLPASNGGTFNLSDQTGKVVLLFFGYTNCADECPTTLGNLKRVRQILGDQADKVQVVFVTTDPDRDNQTQLANYLSLFDDTDIGLTGSPDQLVPVYEAYGVFQEVDKSIETSTGYAVSHSARLYLIDPDGNLLMTYAYGALPQEIAADVSNILKKK